MLVVACNACKCKINVVNLLLGSPKVGASDSYMHTVCLDELLPSGSPRQIPFLDVCLDLSSLSQFYGSQRLEEHYYPTSLAFRKYKLAFNEGSRIEVIISQLYTVWKLFVVYKREVIRDNSRGKASISFNERGVQSKFKKYFS